LEVPAFASGFKWADSGDRAAGTRLGWLDHADFARADVTARRDHEQRAMFAYPTPGATTVRRALSIEPWVSGI
jgi:hypothetical protein